MKNKKSKPFRLTFLFSTRLCRTRPDSYRGNSRRLLSLPFLFSRDLSRTCAYLPVGRFTASELLVLILQSNSITNLFLNALQLQGMKLRTFISIHSILLFLFGLGFLLIPAMMLSVYGTSSNSTGLLTARVFGISCLQLSIIIWYSRNKIGSKLLKILMLLLFLGNALAFTLALHAQISGIFNVLGWTNVALYFLFAFGYGYFLVGYKSESEIN